MNKTQFMDEVRIIIQDNESYTATLKILRLILKENGGMNPNGKGKTILE